MWKYVLDEEWKPIPGYDQHEASSNGRVRKYAPRRTYPRGVRLMYDGGGRFVACIDDKDPSRDVEVARLVLLAFKGASPTPDYEAVNLDGIRHNNHLENLAWKLRIQDYPCETPIYLDELKRVVDLIAAGLLVADARHLKIQTVVTSEMWKPIPGYEGLYEVSNHGRVRIIHAVDRFTTRYRLLRIRRANSLGYSDVGLSKDGEHRHFLVRRLVLLAFVGPPPTPKHQATNIFGIRSDAHLERLAWKSLVEIAKAGRKHGRPCKSSL